MFNQPFSTPAAITAFDQEFRALNGLYSASSPREGTLPAEQRESKAWGHITAMARVLESLWTVCNENYEAWSGFCKTSLRVSPNLAATIVTAAANRQRLAASGKPLPLILLGLAKTL